MSKKPKISIITVTYNADRTLAATIKSVLSQTYESIEFIIVDGGSNDATIPIIKSFQDQIDKTISEPDRGVYDAMNKGIALATGDYVLFLGADDILFNNSTIADCVHFLTSDFDLVYGNVIKLPSNEIYDGCFNLFKLIYKNICHQAIFFNRNLFNHMGDYSLDYKINADWEFNLKCFQDRKIKCKYISVVVSYFNAVGMSSNTEDPAFELRKKDLMKSMPYWVKACFIYRRTGLMKWVSKTFFNFAYA